MSSPASSVAHTPTSKLHVDARAAELRELLLKNRTQKGSRDNSLTPAHEKMAGNNNPDKKSLPNPTSTTTATPKPRTASPFVPHPLPRPPPVKPVDADENDIADLISSISSASRENAGDNPQIPNSAAKARVGAAAKPQQGSKPTKKPANRPSAAEVSARKSSSGGPMAAQTVSKPVKEGEITRNQAGQGRKSGTSELPTARTTQTHTTAANGKSVAPRHNAAKDSKDSGARPIATLKRPSSSSSTASQGREADMKSEADPQKDKEPVSSRSHYQSSAAAGSGGSKNADKEQANTLKSLQPLNDGGMNKHSPEKPVNSEALPHLNQSLAALLERDTDLRDWLDLTQYFDEAARVRKLTRYRKLAEIEAEEKRVQAEKERIDAERHRLLAEEENERHMTWGRASSSATATPLPPSTPLIPALLSANQGDGSGDAATVGKINDAPGGMEGGLRSSSISNPKKRVADDHDTETHPRPTKLPRAEDRGPGANAPYSRQEGDDGNYPTRGRRPATSDSMDHAMDHHLERQCRRLSISDQGSPPRWRSPPGSYGGVDEYRDMEPFFRRPPSPRRPLGPPGYPPRARGYAKYGSYRGDGGRASFRPSPSPTGWRDDNMLMRPKPVTLGSKNGQ